MGSKPPIVGKRANPNTFPANHHSPPCCRLDTSLLSVTQQGAERRSANKVTRRPRALGSKSRFSSNYLELSKIILIFAATQVARKGEWGHDIVVKRTFTNVIFYRQISQIKRTRRYAAETSTLGVLYPAPCLGIVNISRRGLSSCLSLYKAMREPDDGISEVEHPRLSVDKYY